MAEIEIRNVSKTIKGHKVIDNISLKLRSGEIIGFKGVNGSGKTMLMRLIAGLILPDSGDIIIDSERIGKDITFPRSIGILIENPAFLDPYSGFQNLKLLASIKNNIDGSAVKDAISAVGLNPDDKKKYRKYSLGMKQRLGIAAAIMEHPDIILLDEPTNALDSDGVKTVKDLLQKEKERGALIAVSCHNADVLEEMSDRIVLLENGRIAADEGK